MVIEFGSKQAQQIRQRDKLMESVPADIWAEIKDLQRENGDYEMLIADNEREIAQMEDLIRTNNRRINALMREYNIDLGTLVAVVGMK